MHVTAPDFMYAQYIFTHFICETESTDGDYCGDCPHADSAKMIDPGCICTHTLHPIYIAGLEDYHRFGTQDIVWLSKPVKGKWEFVGFVTEKPLSNKYSKSQDSWRKTVFLGPYGKLYFSNEKRMVAVKERLALGRKFGFGIVAPDGSPEGPLAKLYALAVIEAL